MKNRRINSESTVKKHLEERGFTVAITKSENTNGIDIVAIKGENSFLIEVKTATKSTRKSMVGSIGKSGKSCDYIAIVTPNKNIIFQTMKDHLSLTSKNGQRSITKLVRIHDALIEDGCTILTEEK